MNFLISFKMEIQNNYVATLILSAIVVSFKIKNIFIKASTQKNCISLFSLAKKQFSKIVGPSF